MNGDHSSPLPLFLCGVAAGVAVTLLFAPASGAATRSLIGRRFKDGEDWVKDKAAQAESRVRASGEDLRARGEGLLDRVKEVGEVIGRP